MHSGYVTLADLELWLTYSLNSNGSETVTITKGD